MVVDYSLFHSYFAKVHCWFPFLDPSYCKQEYSNLEPACTTKYCMFLLIMALGSIAENDDIRTGLDLATIWAQPAFSLLAVVTMEHTLMAIQCQLLFRFV
jgi:hypothetical protein